MPGLPGSGIYVPLYLHASGYLGVEAPVLCYENHEATTDYFPLSWRSGQVPLAQYYRSLARLQPMLYSPAYRPGYVLLWGRATAPAEVLTSVNAMRIAAYLRQYHYRLRYRSPTGMLELYELPGR